MQTIHLLPLVHLKFRVNAVISVGATFKKLQKSPKNRFSTAFCSILTNVQMTQRLNIWYVYTTTHLVCPNRISSQCHLFCGSYIRKRHFYSIFTAFSRQPRDLRFCVNVVHLHFFVYVKFHINAAFSEAAMFKKVQKTHFYSILQHTDGLPDA